MSFPVGAALAVAGAGIVLVLAGGGAHVDPLGVALALGAAAIYAAYVLASAALLGEIDPLVLAALIASGAALVFCLDAGATGQLAPCGGVHGVALVIAVALSSAVLGTVRSWRASGDSAPRARASSRAPNPRSLRSSRSPCSASASVSYSSSARVWCSRRCRSSNSRCR